MSSEYAAWFAAHRDEFVLGDISQDAFSVFDQYLSLEITAASAASQLVTGRTPAGEDKIRRQVFSLIVAIAQFFPETHLQLVELSKEIFSNPQVDTQPFGWDLRAIHDGKTSSCILLTYSPYSWVISETKPIYTEITNRHCERRTRSRDHGDPEELTIHKTTYQ